MLEVLVAISQKFCCKRKKHGAMQKLFIKKREKKERVDKMTSVQDIENNGYSDASLKKEREMNNIAHVFLQEYFQVSKRDMFSRSIVELGYPQYISTIHPHTCTS